MVPRSAVVSKVQGTGGFSGGSISSNVGALLLREVHLRLVPRPRLELSLIALSSNAIGACGDGERRERAAEPHRLTSHRGISHVSAALETHGKSLTQANTISVQTVIALVTLLLVGSHLVWQTQTPSNR